MLGRVEGEFDEVDALVDGGVEALVGVLESAEGEDEQFELELFYEVEVVE